MKDPEQMTKHELVQEVYKLAEVNQELVDALEKAVDCMETIYDGRNNCGDYEAECPLQDASSNSEYSLLSRLKKSKEALAKYKEFK